jgi:hypothetical protein
MTAAARNRNDGKVTSERYRTGKRWRMAAGGGTKKAVARRSAEWNRLKRLIAATDHIAPYIPVSHFRDYTKYRDAVAVVRAYVKGVIMTLDRDLLVRPATDKYRKHDNGFRPKAA